MRLLAWVDYYGRRCHLMRSSCKNPIRQWNDRDAALSELADEQPDSIFTDEAFALNQFRGRFRSFRRRQPFS
jgi:hypothetical protein